MPARWPTATTYSSRHVCRRVSMITVGGSSSLSLLVLIAGCRTSACASRLWVARRTETAAECTRLHRSVQCAFRWRSINEILLTSDYKLSLLQVVSLVLHSTVLAFFFGLIIYRSLVTRATSFVIRRSSLQMSRKLITETLLSSYPRCDPLF